MAAVGEPISVSTGLVGDINGDFRVTPLDQYAILGNWGRSRMCRYSMGDLNGDGRVGQDGFRSLAVDIMANELFSPPPISTAMATSTATISPRSAAIGSRRSHALHLGDANGDSIRQCRRRRNLRPQPVPRLFRPAPAPLSPVPGDVTGDGIVDGSISTPWHCTSTRP